MDGFKTIDARVAVESPIPGLRLAANLHYLPNSVQLRHRMKIDTSTCLDDLAGELVLDGLAQEA